ncbi:hypothetical protein T07_1968 [Trichinella nelsoni]|uniref:Uncharacterized protein n=1 Tax=Trichinella nelsoni TaxID=6336 RepID=A0A0V0REG7_9BILA|nr:hypothetical protein T07_11548 [Trichinella nelsoni]KRX12682.1 hypothetical protein T07_1968 [Trichinella nelsoni]
MHVHVTDDYDGLKSALFEVFGVRTGSERFSAEFFRRKQQRGESVRVYAGHSRWLFLKAFTVLSGTAAKILLQPFKAALSANAVKTAVLRSRTDSFTDAIEVTVREDAFGEGSPRSRRASLRSKQTLTRNTCSQRTTSQRQQLPF